MSAHTETTLYCDSHGYGCRATFTAPGPGFVTAKSEVRRAAAKAGWVYVPSHLSIGRSLDLGKDYCPEHKPQEEGEPK